MTEIKRKKQRSAAKQLRDNKIIEMTMEGKKGPEICEAMNINRSTVSKALNSEEAKEFIKENRNRLRGLVPASLVAFEDALGCRGDLIHNAIKVAHGVLKSEGILREKIDLEHSFPKPTIIEKLNGDRVILGAAYEDEDYET